MARRTRNTIYHHECGNLKCGKPFTSKYRWQKYCTTDCKVESSNYWKCANRAPAEVFKGDDGHVKEFVHWACEGIDYTFRPLDIPTALRRMPEVAWLMR